MCLGIPGKVVKVYLAAASLVRVRLAEAAVLLRPEVRAACEMLGLDPLYAASEGRLIAVVPPAASDRLLAVMRTHPSAGGRSRRRGGCRTPWCGDAGDPGRGRARGAPSGRGPASEDLLGATP